MHIDRFFKHTLVGNTETIISHHFAIMHWTNCWQLASSFILVEHSGHRWNMLQNKPHRQQPCYTSIITTLATQMTSFPLVARWSACHTRTQIFTCKESVTPPNRNAIWCSLCHPNPLHIFIKPSCHTAISWSDSLINSSTTYLTSSVFASQNFIATLPRMFRSLHSSTFPYSKSIVFKRQTHTAELLKVPPAVNCSTEKTRQTIKITQPQRQRSSDLRRVKDHFLR